MGVEIIVGGGREEGRLFGNERVIREIDFNHQREYSHQLG
jgi:hypothetical protein